MKQKKVTTMINKK